MVAASDRIALAFQLSAGQSHDAPCGRLLLDDYRLEPLAKRGGIFMAMDRGCEDDVTRKPVSEKGFIPVVPPKSNRINPWEYDKERYKRRNEVERLFRRLKRFRKVCTRYDKLDVIREFGIILP
jgi:transposase